VALVLWYTQKKVPHFAIKKPILSNIIDSVNVRILELNMPISFSAVKELSLKHLFLENNQCSPQGPTNFGMFRAPHFSERTKSLGRKLIPGLDTSQIWPYTAFFTFVTLRNLLEDSYFESL